MRKYVLFIALPAMLLGTVLVACGGGGKKTINVPGGGKVSVSQDLPSDFPDDFPKYSGAKVQASYSGEQEGLQGYYVVFETGDSVDDVTSFYEDKFGSGPWKQTGTFSGGGTNTFLAENADTNKTAAVGISESNGKTQISVFLGDNTSGSSSGSGDGEASPTSESSSSSKKTPTPDDSGSSSGSSGGSGSASLPDEVSLDDNYPKDKIPLPDGARVTSSSSYSSNGSRSLYVELYVKTSVGDLEQYYKDKIEAAGYTNAFSSTSNGQVFLTYTTGDLSSSAGVSVTIAKSDVEGYSQVTVTITGPDQ